MFLGFKRILNLAFLSFKRNLVSNFSAILIIFLTIFIITFFYFFQGFLNFLIFQVEEKLNISVYIKEELPEQKILEIKEELSKLPEVKEIDYISSQQVLEEFLKKHQNERIFIEAIETLGENPFLATINIKVKDKSQYSKIVNYLENSSIKDFVDHHNFSETGNLIEKVYSVVDKSKKITLAIIVFFVFISILIVYNTIRITIFSQEKEISIMRSMGASSFYLRGPLILEGAIFGFFAFIFSFLVWSFLAYFLKNKLMIFLGGFDTFSFLIKNWWQIVLIQLVAGVGLGAFSSWLGTREYLK